MKTFDVSLSIDCRLTLEIEASDEQSARQQAAAQVRDGCHMLCDHISEISVNDIEMIE